MTNGRTSKKNKSFLSDEEELLYSRIECALTEDKVDDFEVRLDAALNRKKVIRLTILKVAATVIALLGLGSLGYHLLQPPHKKLFGAYYHHFPVEKTSGLVRGEHDLKTEALLMYSGQDYEQTILKLKEAIREEPGDTEAAFLLAVSCIETGQMEESLEILQDLIRKEEHFYTDDALWYASLICLKKSDYQASREYLLKIRENSEYYQPARELYDKIADK